MKKKSQHEFINDCIEKFGHKYDYSLVDYKNMKTKIKIIFNGKIYEQLPKSHVRGCNPSNNYSNLSNFIEKSNLIHKNKYDYSLVNYINNNINVIIKCDKHGEFLQLPRTHISGIGCTKCSRNTLTKTDFIKLAKSVHSNKYTYNNVELNGNSKIILVNCENHGFFKVTPSNHLSGVGCAKCASNKKFSNSEFINLSKIKYKDYNYNYDKTNYYNYTTSVIITCKNHGDFQVIPTSHLNSNSHCNLCSKRIKWNFEYFTSKGNEIHNNKYIYQKSVFKNSETKVTIICKKHGEFLQTPSCHIRQKQGCPKCRMSKGEQYIIKLLNKNNISYSTQKKFTDCLSKSQLPFDFYIPSKNICIEFDGRQHFEPVSAFGGVKGFEKIKRNDAIKTEYCKHKDITLIRISKIENIEKQLEFIW